MFGLKSGVCVKFKAAVEAQEAGLFLRDEEASGVSPAVCL